ncbi:MAG: hypothetical protein EOP86_23680, partial [Verrucomicrobiaceae bacterium]
MTPSSLCRHCGTPFHPTPSEPEFCCAGCSFVHGMITAGGFEKFYDLKGGATLLPAGGTVLLQPETDWARLAQLESEAAAGEEAQTVEAAFDIQGVSCIGCVWLIESAFARKSGGVRCIVDPSRGVITLNWCRGLFDLADFVRTLASFGYRITAHQEGGGETSTGVSGMKLGLCGGMALNAMAFTLPRYAGMEASSDLAGIFE